MTPTAYPFVNDWARGCWVGRPNGKADRAYVYQRDFVRGTPHKATGMVRYTLEDLGGEGWVVAKDRRGIRSLVRLETLTWTDHGETTPADVLRVVRVDSWDGGRCERCQIGVIVAGESQCVACDREDQRLAEEEEQREKAKAEVDESKEVPF